MAAAAFQQPGMDRRLAKVKDLEVALICDLLEERWFSMDLVAEQVAAHLSAPSLGVRPIVRRPEMVRRLTRVSLTRSLDRADIVDRLVNRHWDYPRWLARQRPADVHHILDHSYAHLALALRGQRVVVTCHDLDAFRGLWNSDERVHPVVRALARRTLRGLQRASVVVCVSAFVRDELMDRGIVPAHRLQVVPNGVHPAFTPAPDPAARDRAEHLMGPDDRWLDVLHVGSTIPRKRIDILLKAFAAIRTAVPRARLVRVGGLNREQRQMARDLGITHAILEVPSIETPVLAALYQRAAVVLMTSDREGFGLPVVEALACDTPVVASDLPALRETGGEAVSYAPPGNAEAFAAAAISVLRAPRRSEPQRLAQAAKFSWAQHAARLAQIYREIA